MDLDQETYNLIRDTNSDVKHIRELLENCQEDIKDHEGRIRDLEAQTNQSIGRLAAASGGSGAVAGGIVVGLLKLMGWF